MKKSQENKQKKKKLAFFPNWILWVSLIFLSIKEILRFTSPNWSENFFLPILFLIILLFIPGSCIFGIIKNNLEKIKYPTWVLWITGIFLVLFQADQLLSGVYFSYKNSVLMGYPMGEIIAVMVGSVGSAIFLGFFTIFIPAYCIKKVIEIKKKK